MLTKITITLENWIDLAVLAAETRGDHKHFCPFNPQCTALASAATQKERSPISPDRRWMPAAAESDSFESLHVFTTSARSFVLLAPAPSRAGTGESGRQHTLHIDTCCQWLGWARFTSALRKNSTYVHQKESVAAAATEAAAAAALENFLDALTPLRRRVDTHFMKQVSSHSIVLSAGRSVGRGSTMMTSQRLVCVCSIYRIYEPHTHVARDH